MARRSSPVAVVLARRTRCPFLRWAPLGRVLAELLEEHGAAGTLSVAVVDDPEIGRIHRDFLGIEGPTDVLSFPLDDETAPPGCRVIGEVVVSADTARREAERRGLDPAREIALYAIHGALHLTGLDDVTPAGRRAMRRAERRWLARLGVPGSSPARTSGKGRGEASRTRAERVQFRRRGGPAAGADVRRRASGEEDRGKSHVRTESSAPSTGPTEDGSGDSSLLCHCKLRTADEIREEIRRLGLKTVEEVYVRVLGGGGCRTCAPEIRKLLSEPASTG